MLTRMHLVADVVVYAPSLFVCQERVLSFGNVELTSGPEDQRNAAEMVVARGFATVVRHRTGEHRSAALPT